MTARQTPRPEKILIIKPSSLGDVISALPVLQGLRRTFRAAHIAWLVTPACAPILAGREELDEVILFDRARYGLLGRSAAATRNFLGFCRRLRRRRFDWVIDLQGLFRSGFLAWVSGAAVRAGFADAREMARAFYTHPIGVRAEHTIDRNIALARALGVKADGEDLALTVTAEARAFVESFLDEHRLAAGGYLVIAPGTRWASKLYPNRHWRKVIAGLSRDVPVVLIGSDDDRDVCADLACAGDGGVFDLAGRTTLPQAVGLIAAAGAVVCCDSAANFIAPAVGTPFVTLIGPTRPERTGPPDKEGAQSRCVGIRKSPTLGTALVADVPCQGCLKRRCRHVRGLQRRCIAAGASTCMQLIAPEDVIAAARRALPAAGDNGRTVS